MLLGAPNAICFCKQKSHMTARALKKGARLASQLAEIRSVDPEEPLH